ncbi:TPA: hypothetical protein DEX28_00885 [Patescibacteria group bacterium]|nr:MAG: Transcription-repair coupling factor [Parcubacteria group bacterium GW2011_GWA1_Parcubacteria_45_10]HCI05282.1 hypothetical protein [Patescibacteria group bacterium]
MLVEKDLLIVAFEPFFLERDQSWLKNNFSRLKAASKTESRWSKRVVFLALDSKIKLSWLFRKLDELGYEKVSLAESPGEFGFSGGVLSIFPPGEFLFQLEFLGDSLEKISQIKQKPSFVRKSRDPEVFSASPGDYLVHLDHGIGIFRGFIDKPSSKNIVNDYREFVSEYPGPGFFVVEYAPPNQNLAKSGSSLPDRLLVPLHKADKLSFYSGFAKPTIHRLGSQVWMLTKKKAKQEIIAFAKELLEIYAKRELSRRPAYPENFEAESILASTFPFTETPDQLKAMNEIDKDLSSSKPMDRILCGDVGFGKTELALRAAVRVALSGKQAVLIAPTTILAYQHFELFQERLKDFPLEISFLSRLVKPMMIKKEKQKILEGRTDIIIGTHRLLSNDLKFKDLGLLIIDEEQRFGVKHKEKLKQLKNNIDILSLSATPIPRTLYLGLAGLRSMSQLLTPPPEKLPTQTFVLPFSWEKLKEAMALEKSRSGQIYLLYNRIAVLEKIRQKLKKIMPEMKISIIHGRQPEKELLKSITDFRSQKTDVLLATTIIENGLDISNANTLLVIDAFRLGLAEAHQLRGRIGRKDLPSFAYFFYHSKRLGDKARERLRILKKYQHLGAGMEIAKKDLELRGAGNILGKDQSGTINSVGLNLYLEMLARVLEELRG